MGSGAWANIAAIMRLLVTGGAGFIGSNFARYWVEQHPEDHVVVYDVLTYAGNRPSLSDLEDRIVFVHGDIGDRPRRRRRSGRGDRHDRPLRRRVPQLPGGAQPGPFFRTNVIGTLAMREVARQPVWRGSTTSRPARSTATCPRHRRSLQRGLALPAPYALQRVEGGGGPRRARLRGDLRAPDTITNCSNNYGPYQFPEKLIPLFGTRALDDKALTLVRQHGEPPRVAACRRPLHRHRGRARPGPCGRAYLVGSGVEATIKEIADLILAALGKPDAQDDRARPARPRPPLPARLLQARSELGWAPSVEFDEGLAATIAWYADNRAWWEPLLARAPVAEGSWGRRAPR